MAKKDKAVATLTKILNIIAKDVNKIQKAYKNQQIPPDEAMILSRYASTLNSISETKEKEKQQNKNKLDKLSTEELIQLYHKEKK